MRLILLSSGFSLVFLVLWNVYIKKTEVSAWIHQNQGNYVLAEKYIIDVKKSNLVMIGSSQAMRIPKKALKKVFNLSLAGRSVFDGLEILDIKGKPYPDTVVIELNNIERPKNDEFIENISSKVLLWIKKRIPSFRTDKQPVSWVVQHYILPKFSTSNSNKKVKENTITVGVNKDKRDKIVAEHLARYNSDDMLVKIDKGILTLREKVDQLIKMEVHVVLFMMPVDEELLNSRKYKYLKTVIPRDFDDVQVVFAPESIAFQTTDGVHLTGAFAADCGKFLMQTIRGH